MKDTKIIIVILLISLLISIPYIIKISKIDKIYADSSIRQGVLASTMYLESAHGILLSSTLHISDVIQDNNILQTKYSFVYPSHLKRCSQKDIVVYYDLNKNKVVNYYIGYYGTDTAIC